MNGDFHQIKEGFGQYMARFYAGLYPDTKALTEFTTRSVQRSIMFTTGRMVDKAEEMLAAYQKNKNSTDTAPYTPGANALFPVMLVGIAKDYTPGGADMGMRQMSRRLVCIDDGPDASVYGYRQAMGDRRAQVAIMAADEPTASSLAAQFSLFLGEIRNRRFYVKHRWGGYELSMPCMIESPDILFASVDAENAGMTILIADLTLKVTIPYLDAPKPGEDNDGTSNDPPGYMTVEQINVLNEITQDIRVVRIEP